jgi:hypothetical protein
VGVIISEKQPVKKRSRKWIFRLFNDTDLNAKDMDQRIKLEADHRCLVGNICEEGCYGLCEGITLVFTRRD